MGKPRMIILIRHAQSEGNLNRDVHQIIPDHRVKLTPEGRKQAAEAGKRLRAMLRPDDTIRLYTSPYRRTRETTEGLLGSLTTSSEETGPSPFSRESIIVREEPRLREQDFGNFQPCSAEMERMWQERADYGHFFYRIPNGESAADAYDRISGFNDSLWRSFEEDDFPSVLVLVTHGLMTRVFLMRWFHYSVESFEDLRNINHCEFVIMNRSEDTGKFVLENKLRTWSELKRRATLSNKDRRQSSGNMLNQAPPAVRQWGGCVDGCNHRSTKAMRRRRTITDSLNAAKDEQEEVAPDEVAVPKATLVGPGVSVPAVEVHSAQLPDSAPLAMPPTAISDPQPTVASLSKSTSNRPISLALRPDRFNIAPLSPLAIHSPFTAHLRGRDAGGTLSGMPTPDTDHFSTEHSDTESVSSTSDAATSHKRAANPGKPAEYFPSSTTVQDRAQSHAHSRRRRERVSRSSPRSVSALGQDEAAPGKEGQISASSTSLEPPGPAKAERKARRNAPMPRRKTTREDMENWMAQSGMGRGTRADALGDAEEEEETSESGSGDEEGHHHHEQDGKQIEAALVHPHEGVKGPTVAEVEKAEEKGRSLRESVY